MALSISPAARHQLTNFLTAFSLGTLCLIRRWYDLENLQPRGLDYFRAAPADSTLLISTVLAALILAAVFWTAWFWVERHPTAGLRKFAHCVFLLILIFPIESVRRYWNTQTDRFDIGSNVALGIVELLLAAGFVAVLLGNTRVLGPARRVALLLMLLFPALMIDFVLSHLSAEPAGVYAPRSPLAPLPARGAHAPRLVWLVFDELDQRLVFERRPAYLELPELDRLRTESLVANHATQTAMFTAIALPSLLSGRVFTNAQAIDANTLNLVPEGSTKPVSWRGEPNVFSRARELGVNAELVGWHHPYCRWPRKRMRQAREFGGRSSNYTGHNFESLRTCFPAAKNLFPSASRTPKFSGTNKVSISRFATTPTLRPPTPKSACFSFISPHPIRFRFTIAGSATSIFAGRWTTSTMWLWWIAL
jgi:hypothetical protein